MNPDDFDSLEKSLQAALRGQPMLRAPAALEQRVRAELAARAERPWWRRSFACWPVPARAVFVTLAVGAGCISIAGTLVVMNGPVAGLAAALAQAFSTARMTAGALVASGAAVMEAISPTWWFLAGTVLVAAGAGVLGVGATAYRVLWKGR
jgi:hypothetical protein